MKVLSSVAVLVFLVLVVEVSAQEKECFNWKTMIDEMKQLCSDCKANYTQKEEIQDCFMNDPKDADENGTYNEENFIKENLEGFTGDAETKTAIENGIKECLKQDSKEAEKMFDCVVDVFKKNCKEAEKMYKEMKDSPELKGCW